MTPPVRPKPLVTVGATLVLLAIAALVLAGSALGGNGGFAPVPPESPNAEGITTSYWFISAFILVIFALVEGLLVLFVVRFRRRRRPRDADGAQIHGSTRLEVMWTIGPVVVLFAIAAFVFVKLPGISDTPRASASGEPPLEIEVVGQQFFWQYRYKNGVVSIDHLRAPVGVPVQLVVTAPTWDVIHSWWIPALGGKIDAIPGRENTTWFEAKRTGTFRGRCAELCGIFHAKMLADVQIMPRAEFDAWLASQRREQQQQPSVDLGAQIWRGACAKCHALDASGEYGPRLSPEQLTNEATLTAVVRNGRALPGRKVMPPVGRDWTTEQLDSLTAYLESVQGAPGGGAG